MNIYCSLRIRTDQDLDTVNKIMDMNINHKSSSLWMLDIEASKDNPHSKILNQFIDLIEAKFSILNSIGIYKNDVSIWLLMESDGEEQSNIEFDAELLSRLSANIVIFCLSSWTI